VYSSAKKLENLQRLMQLPVLHKFNVYILIGHFVYCNDCKNTY